MKNVNPDKLFEKPLIFKEEEDPLLAMANLPERLTGVKGRIRASSQEGSHWARVKFYPFSRDNNKYVSITISDDPEIVETKPANLRVSQSLINQVFGFVKTNKKILLQYWSDDTMYTDIFLKKIKKV